MSTRRTAMHAFVLHNAAFGLSVASPKAKRVPVCVAQFRSSYLTAVGVDAAVEAFQGIAQDLGELSGPLTVSRVDIFADFLSPYALDSWPRAAWVGRSRNVSSYWEGEQSTGWSIGLGKL